MLCPYCGTHIGDDMSVCPACHAELDLTRVLPKLGATYCSGCGALLPEGAVACPSCAKPVPGAWAGERQTAAEPDHAERAVNRRLDLDLPEISSTNLMGGETSSLDATNAMPRIESAIPSESRSDAAEHRLPRTGSVIAGAVASLLFVGGVALAVTHPWDPNAYVWHNTTEKDTSKAGYPGLIESLKGQDSSATSATTTLTADEQALSDLNDYYDRLGDLARKIDDNESTFKEVALGGSASEREEGASSAESLSYEVSNLIDDIEGVNDTSGNYSSDIEHLKTLGNWLRNRVDSLNEAWKASVASDDPSSDRDAIESPLKASQNASGINTYKALFEQNYDAWKPTGSSSD